MAEQLVIEHCFQEHVRQFDSIKFTFDQYKEFWLQHKTGDQYTMKDKNGEQHTVKIVYYPLPYYKELRACVEFERFDPVKKKAYNDFRDVPIHFLERITDTQHGEIDIEN